MKLRYVVDVVLAVLLASAASVLSFSSHSNTLTAQVDSCAEGCERPVQ